MSSVLVSIRGGVPMLPEWQLSGSVDFELLRGEQLAIVGPNGGGKTKLVDIICGRHPLKSGSLEYDFESSSRRFVSENIKYLAFQDCYGGDTDKNYYLQQRWNQWDVSDEKVLMSSGELRKHSMAGILGSDPALLVIDNPYIGLDVTSRAELSEQLRSIADSGRTQLILVLSRTDEVPDFITHVVEVSEGKVLPKQTLSQWRTGLSEVMKLTREVGAKSREEFSESNPKESPEIIRLRGVNIRYGQRTILKDLDWVVREGERWALTGPNGSGKSTLLGIVCCDNPQSYACDIELFGHKRGSGESIWDIKKHIGYVSPELHRSFHVDIEAVKIVAAGLKDYFGLYTSVSDEQLSKAMHWLEVFGIARLAHRKFTSLSSGEQRLVLLARAFVKSPDLLILDEPFHGLDNENRCKVRSIIEEYCKDREKTLIMVSHYAEELPQCIDHSLTLQKH